MHTRYFMPFVLAMSALAVGGCFQYRAAKGEVAEKQPMPAGAWVVPQETAALRALQQQTPDSFVVAEIDREVLQRQYPQLTASSLDQFEAAMIRPINASRIEHGGLVRFWGNNERASSGNRNIRLGPLTSRLEKFTPDGAYLSGEELDWLIARDAIGEDDSIDQLAAYFTSMSGIKRTHAEREWKLREGIRLGLPDPSEEDASARVGTVLHIASFYENKYEHRVLDRLEGYGWAIAHLDPEITLREPNAVELHAYSTKSKALRDAWLDEDPEYQRLRASREMYDKEDLRVLNERFQASHDEVDGQLVRPKTGFEVFPDTDLQSHGQMIARMVDERIAEHAYAAQALIEESDRAFPDLADKPIVVMGFSAGSLVTPAIAQRLRETFPDRKIAIVMIGGGGDLLSASIGSVFTDGGIHLEPRDGPEPTREQLDELVTHYRAASMLDPLTLAPIIRDLPVLHIYASRDTVVPADTARAFNAAHGRVDALSHPFDHDSLFLFLPGEAGRIRTWMRSHGLGD
ncbi:MAG: alpha/beta hydrolase family protein [Phycisphaerales bacterium]